MFVTTCYSYPIVPLSALSVDVSFFTLDICCWWAVLSSALGHLSISLEQDVRGIFKEVLTKDAFEGKRSLAILTILPFDL